MSDEVFPRVVALLEADPPDDDVSKVRAAMALQLARKLDEAVDDTSAGSAQATPGISKELRAVLDDIKEAQGTKEQFVASLFESDED